MFDTINICGWNNTFLYEQKNFCIGFDLVGIGAALFVVRGSFNVLVDWKENSMFLLFIEIKESNRIFKWPFCQSDERDNCKGPNNLNI